VKVNTHSRVYLRALVTCISLQPFINASGFGVEKQVSVDGLADAEIAKKFEQLLLSGEKLPKATGAH